MALMQLETHVSLSPSLSPRRSRSPKHRPAAPAAAASPAEAASPVEAAPPVEAASPEDGNSSGDSWRWRRNNWGDSWGWSNSWWRSHRWRDRKGHGGARRDYFEHDHVEALPISVPAEALERVAAVIADRISATVPPVPAAESVALDPHNKPFVSLQGAADAAEGLQSTAEEDEGLDGASFKPYNGPFQ